MLKLVKQIGQTPSKESTLLIFVFKRQTKALNQVEVQNLVLGLELLKSWRSYLENIILQNNLRMGGIT